MRCFVAAVSVAVLVAGCAIQSPFTKPSMSDSTLDGVIRSDRDLAKNPGGVAICHDIEALIPRGGKVEGPKCTDNKTVVNGWSEKCVANNACNTRQRRQETNQAARSFCADWCAAKKCDFSYSARSACDSSWCDDSRFCVANCDLPKLDTCYFQQPAPNYNCECQDPPPMPSPVVEG